MRREPDLAAAVDVGDQRIQHRHARPVADHVGMHGQLEQAPPPVSPNGRLKPATPIYNQPYPEQG